MLKLQAHLSPEGERALEVIYPGGGCVSSVRHVLNDHAEAALVRIVHMLSLRYDTAISGAMRWPWSQEAAIEVPPVRLV